MLLYEISTTVIQGPWMTNWYEILLPQYYFSPISQRSIAVLATVQLRICVVGVRRGLPHVLAAGPRTGWDRVRRRVRGREDAGAAARVAGETKDLSPVSYSGALRGLMECISVSICPVASCLGSRSIIL